VEHVDGTRVVSNDLLARIREDPTDDALRLVYADLLLEERDPLGELIVLQHRARLGQSSATAERRASAILREHQGAWLGELGLVFRETRFELGFLARAELAPHAAATPEIWARTANDPRLATIIELAIGRGNHAHYQQFVTSPMMRAIASIEIPVSVFLDSLLAIGLPKSVVHLELKQAPSNRLLARIATDDGFASIRSLGLPFNLEGDLEPVIRGLKRSAVLGRVNTLSLGTVQPQHITAIWNGLPELERVRAHLWNGRDWTETTLERTAEGTIATVRGLIDVAGLPREVVELRIVRKGEDSDGDADAYEGAARQWPGMRIALVPAGAQF
jgi:uncharacterized protein (TIGR02996 family)